MALDGTAMGKWAMRFASYAEGKTPCELVPVVGGAAVPFVHDSRRTKLETTEAGGLDRRHLYAMVRQPLETAAQYTHDGETWTVEACEPDKMGGVAWPYAADLVAHAR